MKKLLLLTALLGLTGTLFAQSYHCRFDSIWQEQSEKDSMLIWKHRAHVNRVNDFRSKNNWSWDSYTIGASPYGLSGGAGCSNALFVIPVAVHVVYDPANPASNLADSLIEKQIEYLNAGYSNTGVQFCLAKKDDSGNPISGIDHISDNSGFYERNNDSQRLHLASLAYYDRERFLNIWVVNEIQQNGVPTYVKGYSNIKYQAGLIDGIVMRYEWFGDYSACNTCGFHTDARGKALIHEIGHYLGLFHPFQGQCGEGTDSLTCHKEGDFCCDTRPTLSNFDCPVPLVNQCPVLPYYGSQPDPYDNYMSYADESCLNHFTADQISVFHSQLSNDRRTLVSVDNVNSLDLSCCLSVSWFNIDNAFICEPGTITFKAIDHDSAYDYHWLVFNDSLNIILDTSLTSSSFSWNLSSYGKYHVQLSILVGSDSIVLKRNDILYLKDCGDPLSSSQGNWYFGKYAGLQFKTGGPVASNKASSIPRTIHSGEGAISVSNSIGDLLFYAGGDSSDQNVFRLYRPNSLSGDHEQVYPNVALIGHQSSSQGGIVIPFKHDSTRFHFFVTDAYQKTASVYHNIIDLDSPNLAIAGSINLGVYDSSGISPIASNEIITAAPACDGNYWLIVSVLGGADNNKLYVYLVTDSTITYNSKSDNPVPQYFGQMKVSPDGTKLAAPGIIFNFDRNSGTLTTFKTLPHSNTHYEYYGCSFSPNSRLVYYTTVEEGISQIFQYDLESSDSLLDRKPLPVENDYIFFTALQLGPDDKIYVAQNFSDILGVISNPDARISNLATNACDYSAYGPNLKDSDGNGGECISGLPNFIDALPTDSLSLNFSMLDSACGFVSFTPNDACAGSYQWDFGDGNSSTLKSPMHYYSDTGTYIIKLTVNGLTQVTREISIGIEKPSITGEEIICDSSILYNYYVGDINYSYEYVWEISGGQGYTVSNPYEFEADWENPINIKLIAINPKNSCRDSVIKDVTGSYNLINEIEDSIHIACTNGLPQIIHGSSPSASNFNYAYQWRISTDSVNWQNITGATQRDLQPDSIGDSLRYYQRVIYLPDCDTSYSNITWRSPVPQGISNNSISISSLPELRACGFEITGSLPTVDSGSFEYTWFISETDTPWLTIPSYTWSQKDLEYDFDADSFYVFRKVSNSYCASFSDTLLLKPQVTFTQHPSDYYTCNNRLYFEVKVDNPNNLDLDYTWLFSDTINGSSVGVLSLPWQAVDSLDYVLSPSDTFFGTYYVCQVSTDNCGLYSDWARYTRNPSTSVTIIEQPYALDTIVYEWDSAVIIVKDSSIIHLSETFNQTYQWEVSYDDSAFTLLNPAINNDTIADYDLLACLGMKYYRVKIQVAEDCPFVTSESVGVLAYKNSDLWGQDSPIDTGGEPNNLSNKNYWNSLDIWNNTDSGSYSSSHQNPEFKVLSPNRIFVRVRNKGLGYSKPSSLYLYWTVPSNREDWPIDWHYDLTLNGFYNADSSKSFPLGSEINDTAIIIGPLAPGTDTIVSYDWWPPNPNWYYTYVNGNKEYYSERMLCFLSRIVECDESPFGMAFLEEEENTVNVRNNNNIITKNVTLRNTSSTDTYIPVKTYYPVVIGRNYDLAPALTLKLTNLGSSSYFDYGEISVILDDSLYAAWLAGGEQGYGFSADGNVITVTDISTFQLNNIVTTNSNDMQAIVVLEFNDYPFGLPVPYSFRFTQYSGTLTEPDGGVYFEGYVPGYIPSVEKNVLADSGTIQDEESVIKVSGVEQKQTEITKGDSTANPLSQVTTNSVKAFPVPFSTHVNIEFELDQEKDISLELFDAAGAKVYNLSSRNYSKGLHRIVLDASQLAPGMYLCKVKMGDEIETLHLVVAR